MARARERLGYSDVRAFLDRFWIVFSTVTSQAGLPVAPRPFPFKIVYLDHEQSRVIVSLKSPLHLKNWPYKAASSGTPNLHIIVDARETIDIQKSKIVHSWVQVIYYEEKPLGEDSLLPIESIHYDYKAIPAQAHPVFHAQFCHEVISDDNKNRVETLRNFTILNDSFGDRYRHLKIPTAHMNLISVLLSLCADHIPTRVSASRLKDLFEGVSKIRRMPTVEAESLSNSIRNTGSYCSMYWYVT
ncbi:hypothetical protein ES708_02679 [subsurface metagenome]